MKIFSTAVLLSALCSLTAIVHAQTPDTVRIERSTEGSTIPSSQNTDTLRTEYSQTIDPVPGPPLDNKGKYRLHKFLRNSYAEKTLVKIGFWGLPPFIAEYETMVEHKIATSWSIGGGARTAHAWLPRQGRAVAISYMVSGRYYYNMKRRIEQGRGADNLIGSYFMLSTGATTFVKGVIFSTSTIEPTIKTSTKEHPRISFSWGNQKRLGRFGYFDMALLLDYLLGRTEQSFFSRFGFGINMKLGLGL